MYDSADDATLVGASSDGSVVGRCVVLQRIGAGGMGASPRTPLLPGDLAISAGVRMVLRTRG